MGAPQESSKGCVEPEAHASHMLWGSRAPGREVRVENREGTCYSTPQRPRESTARPQAQCPLPSFTVSGGQLLTRHLEALLVHQQHLTQVAQKTGACPQSARVPKALTPTRQGYASQTAQQGLALLSVTSSPIRTTASPHSTARGNHCSRNICAGSGSLKNKHVEAQSPPCSHRTDHWLS